jgi:peptidoglycan/LPS O-acetylase OafA/YrhL
MDGLLPSVCTILTKVVLTVAVAAVSWNFFERPILALKRHFASRTRSSDEEIVSSPVSSVTSEPLPSTPVT